MITATKEHKMNGKTRIGRRYSLRIDGDLFDPADFNESGAYNPSNLNAEARKVAARAAAALGVEVQLVKHLAGEDREEGYYNEWTLRASQAIR